MEKNAHQMSMSEKSKGNLTWSNVLLKTKINIIIILFEGEKIPPKNKLKML